MRVSVVMAVHNGAWCVERALDSVLAQSEPPEEVLVCDDASTDGTPDLVEARYGAAVQVLRLARTNAAATRRVGLRRARGDWLAFLDADDRWQPGKLEAQRLFLERHAAVRWLGSDGRYVSAEGVVRESWLADYFDPVRDMAGDLMPALIERCFPLVSSMLVAREAYEAVGGLDPELVFSHDYDLWMRLAGRYDGAMMAASLVDYFTGPTSLSRNLEARHRDDLRVMRRAEQGAYGDRSGLRLRAAHRAAALEFKLGLIALREGRRGEARVRFRRASRLGPWRRRMVAAGGAFLPDRALTWLMRSPWAKSAVAATRQKPASLEPKEGK